jgi:hypothetical protein
VIFEYHLTYEADSPGEVEDIEQRLLATNPLTMDPVQENETWIDPRRGYREAA